MKIERVQSRIVSLPPDEPLAGGPAGHGPPRDFVCLSVTTNDGVEGIGVTFFGAALTRALKQAVDALGALIVGDDPRHTEAIADKLRNAAGTSGPGGIFTLALSAIDTALWDIKGKAANLSLASLLGGRRSKVPAYASGALMRTFPLNHLAKAAETLVKNGYTQMKTQAGLLGDTTPEQEVERIRVVREAIGPDVALMCDINQRWTVDQAIGIGRRFEEFHLAWLEDVTTADDYAGLARVAQQLDTPVAGGEYVYGIAPFRHMLEARSVDIAMIDLFRVGGITQWMKVAGMAEAFNVPVVSHLIPEIHVHLIAAVPNGRVVEYMPWTMRLFEDPPVPVRGEITAPKGPGLGLRFSAEIRGRFAAAE
ncbi:MAG TPA: mandelate racemase/muconate lactonizing enzyme family protein [Alphaproteobacteria bacterium]|nr:mandelate racemase/muconate lactonizing enzyme family protein [Alphaproteobacteria bacterium]